MRSFACPVCHQLVFFDNSECLRCHSALGFAVDQREIVAVEPDPAGEPYQRCANAAVAACNWLVTDDDGLCLSCRLTRTRPSDDDEEALVSFAQTEAAKRRLVFQLLELGLPVEPYDQDTEEGLAFDLLSSQFEKVTIGHADGLITLNLSESDDAYRESMRQKLDEPYRTMLGHLRHEVGHFYFQTIVVPDADLLARARELFGDDTIDYGEALDRHYDQGPPENWPDDHVSSYATMHPFEDWAETFAHYLHIRDTMQTAAAVGMHISGPVGTTVDADPQALASDPGLDADESSFRQLIGDWLPLTYALNAVNRAMGSGDLYPFVLAPTVIDKMTFVDDVVRRHQTT